MKELVISLDYLNKITNDSSKEEIIEIASNAFSNCRFCLEAAAILFNTMDDEKEKEAFLSDAINNVEIAIRDENMNDKFVFRSLIRGYIEIGCFYISLGKINKAIESLERAKAIDINNEFSLENRLISLYAYIEDKKNVERIYENSIDKDNFTRLKINLAYLVYLYKSNRYDELLKVLIDIEKENSSLIEILIGGINENTPQSEEIKQALTVLKNNAYLLNSCPELIKYIKGVYND